MEPPVSDLVLIKKHEREEVMRILTISKLNALLIGLMVMAILICWSSQAQADEDGDYDYYATKLSYSAGDALDLSGDVNSDGSINILDLLFISANIGQPTTNADAYKSDVNQDKQVNILDLLMVAQKIGNPGGDPLGGDLVDY